MMTATSCRPWQPLTFGGVASFAGTTFTRLWIVQFLVSLLVAGSVVWLLWTAWFPIIATAIDALPAEAVIHDRRLTWPAPPGTILAGNSFLSIRASPEGSFADGPGAEVQWVLGSTHLRIASLLGFVEIPYPAGWTVSLNRVAARAWWDAWKLFVLMGAGVATIAILFASWVILASLYFLPVRLLAFYLDREVTAAGSWRLAGAALLPGAIVMSGALLLYSTRRLEVVGLLFAWLLHFVIGWVYAACVPARLPRLNGPGLRRNPFRAKQPET